METIDFRAAEVAQVQSALLAGQGILVLGESGSGKSFLGSQVLETLVSQGYTAAVGVYGGSAKETLLGLAAGLGVACCEEIPAEGKRSAKTRPFTAQEIKDVLVARLAQSRTLLVVEDAHRWPASLRYWLEAVHGAGGLMLMLANQPPAKDIFLKLPRIELQPLKNDQIRTLMYQEALDQGLTLKPGRFAELQQRVGGNPALARRVVHEERLGIGGEQTVDHRQYVDGTPFLVAGLSAIGIVRFVGIGLGDRALYIIGGVATILAIALRGLMYAANRGQSRTKLGRG
jgi:hypothetical protein